MFETYEDFTDELNMVFEDLMVSNEPEDLDSAVEVIIETSELDECKEYFLEDNFEEDWEEMLVEMCKEYIEGL